MNNGEKNAAFLTGIDGKIRLKILTAIAEHYGITPDAALAEVTDLEAEHLCDYLTEPIRMATHVLMQRFCLMVIR